MIDFSMLHQNATFLRYKQIAKEAVLIPDTAVTNSQSFMSRLLEAEISPTNPDDMVLAISAFAIAWNSRMDAMGYSNN